MTLSRPPKCVEVAQTIQLVFRKLFWDIISPIPRQIKCSIIQIRKIDGKAVRTNGKGGKNGADAFVQYYYAIHEERYNQETIRALFG
jgi:hypothetical protein